MTPGAAIRRGRSPQDGYRRGWGLEFGDLRKTIMANEDFRNALAYTEDRTVVSLDRLMNLFVIITEYLPKLPPGHIIEFGSYRAGSTFFMGALAIKFLPGTQIYALDTFDGMPDTDAEIDAHGRGDFQVDFSEIMSAREKHGLTNVHLVKGLFSDTALAVLAEAASIILSHIDCDIYESVRYAYDSCREFMAPGGYIVFDDSTSSSCLGATEAVEMFVVRRDGLLSEQIWPHHVFRAPAAADRGGL
jgi:hypothetical protein